MGQPCSAMLLKWQHLLPRCTNYNWASSLMPPAFRHIQTIENESTSGSDNWHHSHSHSMSANNGSCLQGCCRCCCLLISFIEKLNSTQITCKLPAYGKSWLDVAKREEGRKRGSIIKSTKNKTVDQNLV